MLTTKIVSPFKKRMKVTFSNFSGNKIHINIGSKTNENIISDTFEYSIIYMHDIFWLTITITNSNFSKDKIHKKIRRLVNVNKVSAIMLIFKFLPEWYHLVKDEHYRQKFLKGQKIPVKLEDKWIISKSQLPYYQFPFVMVFLHSKFDSLLAGQLSMLSSFWRVEVTPSVQRKITNERQGMSKKKKKERNRRILTRKELIVYNK